MSHAGTRRPISGLWGEGKCFAAPQGTVTVRRSVPRASCAIDANAALVAATAVPRKLDAQRISEAPPSISAGARLLYDIVDLDPARLLPEEHSVAREKDVLF